MLVNYPFDRMAQAAIDMAAANKQVAELQNQFQTAIQRLLAAWSSQEASPAVQDVQQLWRQANEEINLVLHRRGTALDEAWMQMKRADNHAANSVRT